MPTQVDAPINVGSPTDWGLFGSAGSKVSAVKNNDGNASIVFASSGGRLVSDDYVFSPLAGVTDPISAASLTAVTRTYLKGAGGRAYFIRWNGVRSGSNRQAEVRLQEPNYVSITYTATGGELALASVNGEHGMEFSAAGGPTQKAEYWVTQVFRSTTFGYTAGSAEGFGYQMGAIAAAIGAGLLMRDMPALAKRLWTERRFLIHPEEYGEALRAWQAQKRMVGA